MAQNKTKKYLIDNPDLMIEWDAAKNESLGLDPAGITCGSKKKAWWKGKCGHGWQAVVKSRNYGHGCPYCNGKQVLVGFNDLNSIAPQLAKEWDYDKNSGITPKEVTIGSHKKVWWIGKCGHSWQAQIKSRIRGTGCPYCDGKLILKGFNDLKTVVPTIANEWNYEKNNEFSIDEIAANSHATVWWKCANGHEWQSSPNNRVSKNRGCPYCCHNPKVLSGINDFATKYPDLLKEWHPIKNTDIFPDQLMPNSNTKVWWKCVKGHEWKTSVNHRTNGSNCPFCSQSAQTSFPEQAIYYYVKKAYPDAINGFTDLFNNHGMELDVFVPSLKIGIEYDGIAFHKKRTHKLREQNKYKICQDASVKLIRIREDLSNTETIICDKLIFVDPDLKSAIEELKEYLPKLGVIDIDNDSKIIKSGYLSDREKNSLFYQNPNLAEEWNYDKNGALSPKMFSCNSGESVWWKCDNGHEWKAKIGSRNRGNGCPYCSNRLVLSGYNDLAHVREDLMIEWDYSKNPIDPTTITSGSGKKAWWKCSKCGHEWLAEISSRNKGHGCPECAKKRRETT